MEQCYTAIPIVNITLKNYHYNRVLRWPELPPAATGGFFFLAGAGQTHSKAYLLVCQF